MKKIFFLAPLMALLLFVGCKKIDQLLTFTVDTSESVVIPGLAGTTQLPKPVTVTTNSATSFSNNKTSKDKVKDVYLDQMVLTITSPSGANFDFLDKLDVYINTPNTNNKILLATTPATVPRGVNTIKLVPTTARLDEYLKADTYQLTVDATTNRFSASDFTVRADSRFKVTANPL